MFVRAGDVRVGKWYRNPERLYRQSWVDEDDFARVFGVE